MVPTKFFVMVMSDERSVLKSRVQSTVIVNYLRPGRAGALQNRSRMYVRTYSTYIHSTYSHQSVSMVCSKSRYDFGARKKFAYKPFHSRFTCCVAYSQSTLYSQSVSRTSSYSKSQISATRPLATRPDTSSHGTVVKKEHAMTI